jgi:transcriptional regulator with XRE-family HTH domain
MTIDIDAETLGRCIQTRRERLGIAQDVLARRVHVSPSTIARLEQGRTTKPKDRDLIAIAAVLGTTIDALVSEAAIPPPEPSQPVDPRAVDLYGGDPRALRVFAEQTAGLRPDELDLVLDGIRRSRERIDAVRDWERRRREAAESESDTVDD